MTEVKPYNILDSVTVYENDFEVVFVLILVRVYYNNAEHSQYLKNKLSFILILLSSALAWYKQ